MRILITGLHGFVGSSLTEYLKKEHQIFGLDIIDIERDGVVKTFNWNALDEIPTIDAIIHLAGKAHDVKNTSNPDEYFKINVGLTQIIFDFYLKSGAKKFIFFSSVKAVADTVENGILTENDNPNPQTAYGKSKLEAESYILSKPFPQNKQVYILRPAMIHGPGNKGNLNLLYNFVSKGLPYPLGAFDNLRSFTSIANLNFVVGQLLERTLPSDIFQIADDAPLSSTEIVQLIALVKGKKSKIWKLPVSFIMLLAKIGDIIKLPVNSERIKKLTETYIVSNKKLVKTLEIELPVSSRDGLIYTLSSFQSHKTNTTNNKQV